MKSDNSSQNSGDGISIETLLKHKFLRKSAADFCLKHNFSTYYEITLYYDNHSSFDKLKGGSEKVKHNLIELCKINSKEIYNKVYKFSGIDNDDYYRKTIRTLNIYQRKILRNHTEFLVSTLPNRVKKVIDEDENISRGDFFNMLFDPAINFDAIKKIGERSVFEIDQIKKRLKTFISGLTRITTNGFAAWYICSLISPDEDNTISKDQLANYLSLDGKVKLFSLLYKLIESDRIYLHNDKGIFLKDYCYSTSIQNEEMMISDDLSSEGIRQIKKRIEREVNLHFSFVKNFKIDSIANYEVGLNFFNHDLNEEIVKVINENQNVTFKFDFYKLIFEILGNSVADSAMIEEKEEMDLKEDISPRFDILNAPPKFKEKIVRIRNRNSQIVRKLKELYKGECQISHDRFKFIMTNGKPYCEVHHLIPLGEGGSDSFENIIVVSPLIHRMLHYADVSEINLDKIKDFKLKIRVNQEEFEITWNPFHRQIVEGILE